MLVEAQAMLIPRCVAVHGVSVLYTTVIYLLWND